MTYRKSLRWSDVRDLLQKVERDSHSVETLGLHAVDDVLSDLNRILAFLQSFKRVVQSRRNALSDISRRLPNETLCLIFSMLDIKPLLSGMHLPL